MHCLGSSDMVSLVMTIPLQDSAVADRHDATHMGTACILNGVDAVNQDAHDSWHPASCSGLDLPFVKRKFIDMLCKEVSEVGSAR